jgi:hypothetical protein
MDTNYPYCIEIYFKNNPSLFEERADSGKKIVNYVLLAVFILFVIAVLVIPTGSLLIKIIAFVGLAYAVFRFFSGSTNWYNIQSGGKIKELATKKFAVPDRGSEPLGKDDQKVLQMFANNDWAGLADEPEADNRPLQLDIQEDEIGRTFYLQLRRYFSASDMNGVSEVKTVAEPQYSEYYQIIKSIKST